MEATEVNFCLVWKLFLQTYTQKQNLSRIFLLIQKVGINTHLKFYIPFIFLTKSFFAFEYILLKTEKESVVTIL